MFIGEDGISDERLGASAPTSWSMHLVLTGLACYALTSTVPSLGVLAGYSFFSPGRSIPYGQSEPLLRFAAWDGGRYAEIAEQGYTFESGEMSTVAFFPAFPMLARGLSLLTGCSVWTALIAISHMCLAASFVLFLRFASLRFPEAPKIATWSTLAFGLFPTTFYFRMAYSESLFVLLSIIVFYGIERRWSVYLLASAAGACSAVRPVGIALLLPLVLYVWQTEHSCRLLWIKIANAILLSLSGLGAYMIWLWQSFGDPFVFAEAQGAYWLRPPIHLPDLIPRLIVLEPIWGTFYPASDAYWRRHSPMPAPLFNMQFANPLYFLLAAALLAVGWSKRWLNNYERWFVLALLVIPYATRSYLYCMASQARFATVAVPLYLVMGCILTRLPPIGAASIIAICSLFLGIYAALFASWYFFV